MGQDEDFEMFPHFGNLADLEFGRIGTVSVAITPKCTSPHKRVDARRFDLEGMMMKWMGTGDDCGSRYHHETDHQTPSALEDCFIPKSTRHEALYRLDGICYPSRDAKIYLIVVCGDKHSDAEQYLRMLVYLQGFPDLDLSEKP